MCKITILPNPHIYWVVIYVHIYIIVLGLIILILGALNTSQYGKLDGKLMGESIINVLAIIFGVIVIAIGAIGIILVIWWKWKNLAIHSAITLFVAVLSLIAGKLLVLRLSGIIIV